MKLEKHSAAAEETAAAETAETAVEEKSVPTISADKQKPVYMYIAILFVAAAMLIVISLVMHRSSNEEVIGELQSSVNALEALQESQLQNMELQNQLEEKADLIADLEGQLAALEASKKEEADAAAATMEALQWLAIIEQQYGMEEYETCFESIEKFKLSGTVDYLPTDNALTETAVSPAERFADIQLAVTHMDIS